MQCKLQHEAFERACEKRQHDCCKVEPKFSQSCSQIKNTKATTQSCKTDPQRATTHEDDEDHFKLRAVPPEVGSKYFGGYKVCRPTLKGSAPHRHGY